MKAKKNGLEWAVFAVSLLILIGFVGTLVYLASTAGDRPADLVVELGEPQQMSAGFAVPVRVHNRGDRTAEEVRVEITLAQDGKAAQERELTFPFLPRRSERDGFVVFDRDPRCCELSGRATAYEEP